MEAALYCFYGVAGRSKLPASIAAMMALTVLCAAIWLMPYLENFKSPRLFSQQVNQIVPATVPVYVYADTMNDFNFYTARDVMPILSTPLALDALLARGQGGYLLIKGGLYSAYRSCRASGLSLPKQGVVRPGIWLKSARQHRSINEPIGGGE